MKRVMLAPAARADLASIRSYTLERWGLGQAETYLRGLGDCLTALAAGSAITRPADHIRPGYRRLRYGSHFLFFLEEEQTVRIVRILHQRMDQEAQLEGG